MRFRDAAPERLRKLSDSQWSDLLGFADTMHLTLYFGRACNEFLPQWVKDRIAQNYADNLVRVQRAKATYEEVGRVLVGADVEHLVLKGFARWPDETWDLTLHMQSDIDLYCLPESLDRALQSIRALGYRPVKGMEGVVTDHLPTLMRPNGWRWRGYFFDPEMPLAIELHYRLWDREGMHFGPKQLDGFWQRRVLRQLGGMCFTTLHPVDALAFSCLHILRHLFRGGELLTAHVYELAWFLQATNGDSKFGPSGSRRKTSRYVMQAQSAFN